jgi:hypothetical protein
LSIQLEDVQAFFPNTPEEWSIRVSSPPVGTSLPVGEAAFAAIADKIFQHLSPGFTEAARGSAFELQYTPNDCMPSGGFNQFADFDCDNGGVMDGVLSPIMVADGTGLTPVVDDGCRDGAQAEGPVSPLLFDVQDVLGQPELSMDVDRPVTSVSPVPVAEALTVDVYEAPHVPELPSSVLPELPIVKRRRKQVKVPANKQDAKYHAYRVKNTAKAKAIRDRKREEKKAAKKRLEAALSTNAELRSEVERLEAVFEQLKARASQSSSVTFANSCRA